MRRNSAVPSSNLLACSKALVGSSDWRPEFRAQRTQFHLSPSKFVKFEHPGALMAAHAGKGAWNTGTFKCQSCNAEVRVRKGSTIPKCPNGHSKFDKRLDEQEQTFEESPAVAAAPLIRLAS